VPLLEVLTNYLLKNCNIQDRLPKTDPSPIDGSNLKRLIRPPFEEILMENEARSKKKLLEMKNWKPLQQMGIVPAEVAARMDREGSDFDR